MSTQQELNQIHDEIKELTGFLPDGFKKILQTWNVRCMERNERIANESGNRNFQQV